jgi:RNase P/RNase MRP subunit p29
VAVLVLLLGSAVWSYFGPSSGTPSQPVPTVRARGGTPARDRAARSEQGGQGGEVTAEGLRVKLSALGEARQQPADSPRNPFRFGVKPAPPRPVEVAPQPASPVLTAPVVPAGPPPPPPITLKFIGLVEKADGTKVAVLTDGHNTSYGVQGGIVDGRYRIVRIGTESIEMQYVDGRGRQTIRLTGQ